jgi:hypothetical protein
MKFVLLLFVCLTAIVVADEAENLKEWQAFKVKNFFFHFWLIINLNIFSHHLQVEHGKTGYDAAQDTAHYATFLRNKAQVEAHNERFALGKETYEKGINQFSDIEHDEFVATHTGVKVP